MFLIFFIEIFKVRVGNDLNRMERFDQFLKNTEEEENDSD